MAYAVFHIGIRAHFHSPRTVYTHLPFFLLLIISLVFRSSSVLSSFFLRLVVVVVAFLQNTTGHVTNVKGEVHPKMITSYLVVFGVLSRMVKVKGACDKAFWVYKAKH